MAYVSCWRCANVCEDVKESEWLYFMLYILWWGEGFSQVFSPSGLDSRISSIQFQFMVFHSWVIWIFCIQMDPYWILTLLWWLNPQAIQCPLLFYLWNLSTHTICWSRNLACRTQVESHQQAEVTSIMSEKVFLWI